MRVVGRRVSDIEAADERRRRRSSSLRRLSSAMLARFGPSREMVTLKATLCGRKQPSDLAVLGQKAEAFADGARAGSLMRNGLPRS